MSRLRLLALALLLAGCDSPQDPGSDGSASDADHDGFASPEDCADADAAVNPGAAERCNGMDDDCDGTIDVGATDALTVYTDGDGDRYGDPATAASACAVGAGQVDNGDDCDDAAAAVSPTALELCNDVDDDCDGAVDEGAFDATTWYPDVDGDGYGAEFEGKLQCPPSGGGSSATGGDCDDANPAVAPGATERCDGLDNDCDPVTMEGGVWAEQSTGWTDWTPALAGASPDSPALGTLAGGTLHVCDGTWYLQLTVTASGEVVGHTRYTPATIAAGKTGSAVRSRGVGAAVDLTLRDLVIEGGTGAYSEAANFYGGGGVQCDGTGSDTLWLHGVTVTGGDAMAGGAVLAVDCNVTVVGSTLSDNYAQNGGAVLIYSHAYSVALTLEDSLIANNTAAKGGGIYIETSSASTVDLVDTLVSGNSATSSGGGMMSALAVTTTCRGDASTEAGFHGNSATVGGAVTYVGDEYANAFSGTSCDLGEPGTSADNGPLEVYGADFGTSAVYGEDATFACDATGCR